VFDGNKTSVLPYAPTGIVVFAIENLPEVFTPGRF